MQDGARFGCHGGGGSNGKVHGLEGLRVVDASIMPTLVRAPINPTVLMIGERIAALMRQGK